MSSNVAPMKASVNCEPLKKLIREVPDFPKKGILFYDITTVLKDKLGFAMLIDALSEHYIDQKIDLVLGMEARGFIFAPALAYRLNAGFVPVRKPGQTSVCDDEVRLRAGIWNEHTGDSQRRYSERSAGDHRGRPVSYGRNG